MSKNHHHKNRIDGCFAPHLAEMLESPAWCILSRAARQILDYCEIRLARHWAKNGQLIMTYDELVAYGVHRHAIAPAIRELIALGFIEVTEQGRAGNAECRRPTKVRVTYLKTKDAPPAHEWRHITKDDAAMIAKSARRPAPENRNPVPESALTSAPESALKLSAESVLKSVRKAH
jgi:hypothetical protein